MQSRFQSDTVKIAYDADGIIRQTVDKPDTEGNYDVSLLVPINLSVAEVAVATYPAGVTLDNSWKFDGESVYQDMNIVTAQRLALNTDLRTQYAAQAALIISTLQNRVSIGRARDGDADALTAWQHYLLDLDELTDAQLSSADFVFPPVPGQ